MKLSNSEKTLIWLFVNVTTLMLGMKVLLPKVQADYMLAQQEVLIYREKSLQVEELLALAPVIDERLEENRQKVDRRIVPFWDIRDTEYIDIWLRKIARSSQSTISTLEIGQATVMEVQGYKLVPNELQYPLKSYYDQFIKTEGEDRLADSSFYLSPSEIPVENNDSDVEGAIVQTNGYLTVQGDRKNLLAFMDQLVSNDKYITIDQMTLQGNEMNINFTLYAVHRTIDEALDYDFKMPVGKSSIAE